ncbi:helix-turn-helix transcriptional regulator [Promicromonospora sukumoe]|uniref:helix-turn-helix transcriptional regulator n=1 Tax=Promicromonospora sukumoe TaxID=88382 RepID=UPI000364CAFE|nr:LuxR family transcriptional regulator [Promicromonospora sukumoe]
MGRTSELESLVDKVRATPSLVVIDGEAGVGKSRLVRELATDPALAGMPVLIGHCEHLQEPLPLAPVLDVLSHHADLVRPGDYNPVVGALAPLVPELGDRLPPPPPELADQRAARHRVFRAAAELLDRMGPAVLVLEDVHWAESSTFDFLTFLAAHQPAGLCIVLTLRSGGSPLPVRESFARAASGPPLALTLSPLDPAGVGELAGRILGTEVSAGFAATLHERTGGIPFVAEEVLGALHETPLPDDAAQQDDVLTDLAVPTALRDVVLGRLDGVAEGTREVLGVASVLDHPVDVDLIAEVTGLPPARVVEALVDAITAGLLHEQDGQVRFRHVLAEQIVYDALPTPTRRLLHRTVARAIEDRDGPRPVARLAHHYHRAGDTVRFVAYAEDAADLAVSHGDDAHAARLLVQAMEADLPTEQRLRLAVKLGRAAVDGLAHEEAVPLLQQLLAGELLPGDVRGELRFALGRLFRQQGLADAGYREIELALPDLADNPALLARALAILAAPETVTDRPMAVHARRGEQAQDAARRSGAVEVELAVRIARASLLIEQGDPEGWPLVEALLGDAALPAHPREHARACVNWAQAALHVGHVRRAERLLAEGRRVVAAAEYLRVNDVIELVAAAVDCAAGRWGDLAGRAHELVVRRPGFDAASLDDRLLHGVMLAASGGASEAAAHFTDLVEDAVRVGAVWPLLAGRSALARLLLTLDDVEGSAHQADLAVAAARQKGNWVWAAEPMLCLVDALVAQGRTPQARAHVEELAAGLGVVDAPLARAALLTCRAVVARADGDHAGAVGLLREARAVVVEAGLRPEESRAVERLGEWLAEDGDAEGAALLEEALRGYGARAASNDVARVTRTLRRLGLPVPYPWRGGRRSNGLGLSGREREVALLAAQGRTNRQIAADLFLSPRTVESHVRNALRKLDCTSRADLAVRLLDAAEEDRAPVAG